MALQQGRAGFRSPIAFGNGGFSRDLARPMRFFEASAAAKYRVPARRPAAARRGDGASLPGVFRGTRRGSRRLPFL